MEEYLKQLGIIDFETFEYMARFGGISNDFVIRDIGLAVYRRKHFLIEEKQNLSIMSSIGSYDIYLLPAELLMKLDKYYDAKNSGLENTTLDEIVIKPNNNETLGIGEVITYGQLSGGLGIGIIQTNLSKYQYKSHYLLGRVDNSHIIDFSNQTKILNAGGNGYVKGYKEFIATANKLSKTLNVASHTLNYLGYVDGGIKVINGEFASGAHSVGNNYLGIAIGNSLGGGYGLAYTASYTFFENKLPKSELYNRFIFGKQSKTYKQRATEHGFAKSKIFPDL